MNTMLARTIISCPNPKQTGQRKRVLTPPSLSRSLSLSLVSVSVSISRYLVAGIFIDAAERGEEDLVDDLCLAQVLALPQHQA